jgi:uncharacterized coiled-coil protein SlyX
MKTAMQELIDEMNEMLIDGNGSIYVLKEQARKLLKKEKEQIENAYDAGQLHFWPDEFLQRGEYYYNETFNTNEK